MTRAKSTPRQPGLTLTPEQLEEEESRLNGDAILRKITTITVGRVQWTDYADTGITGAEIERVLARQWAGPGIAQGGAVARIEQGAACLWFGGIPPKDLPPDLSGPELYSAIRRIWHLSEPADPFSGNGNGQMKRGKRHAGNQAAGLDAVHPISAAIATPATRLVEARAELLVESIDDSPWQTREEPTRESIEELSRSIRINGLLKPIRVRRAADPDRYQLIGGHRRLRAVRSLGWATITADVVCCDDVTASREVFEDNRQEPLNDIERAKGLKAMWSVYTSEGKTQRELAADVGLSQGAVSNLIRLLDAPEDLRQRVISGEIAASQLRSLLPWVERPAIMETIAKELGKRCSEGPIENHHLRAALGSAIERHSRPVTKSPHGTSTNEPLFDCDKHLGELDVVEYRVESLMGAGVRTECRAFNVERWKQLQSAAMEKRKERDRKKSEKQQRAKTAVAGDVHESPQRTDTDSWPFQRAMNESWRDPQWRAIGKACTRSRMIKAERHTAARMVILLARHVAVAEVCHSLSLAADDYVAHCLGVIGERWGDRSPVGIEDHELSQLADHFRCSISAAWKPTEALLAATARADLDDFAQELDIASEEVEQASDEALRSLLLSRWNAGYVPDIYRPRPA